jgi:PQQ-dependent dehydrogenase (methanol/ethanol family)
MCCGPSNRGVAIHDNQLFFGTVDARVISLDMTTGEIIWDINVADNLINTASINNSNTQNLSHPSSASRETRVGISMAPIVYENKVIIGITGVGYGIHVEEENKILLDTITRKSGFLAAYDISSGEQIWRFNTIPNEGWEGKFTNYTQDGVVLNRDIYSEKENLFKYPDAAKLGGGSIWTTPAIDQQTNTLFFGTGNPSPQLSGETRPGDNLYTVSLVAVDVNTGKLKWHYQQVPHDVWGYDVASPPVLFYTLHDDKIIPAVGQAGKTGWFYIHNRDTGELILKSDAFVPQSNLFSNASPGGTIIYPGNLGGSNWSPVSLNVDLNLAFISGIHAPIKYTLHDKIIEDKVLHYVSSQPSNDPQWGLLSAIDLSSGKIIWQHKTEQPLLGGTLSTKGNLIFSGEGNGNFNAFNALTGDLIWQTKIAAGVNAPPITYMINGKQYIAVVAGGNKIMGYKQGDFISVYQLSD